jgi:2'-5' RNA ligase
VARAARPEGSPLRLFVAVDVPQAVKAELARAVEPFRRVVPGARWTSPEGWHVTLKFLGSTWPRLVEGVKEAVGGAAREAAPFPTSLTEVGAFPGPGRARVVWAGLADPEGRFASLARALDALLAPHVPPEKRPFTPHLTVARLNPPVDLRAVAPELLGLRVDSSAFTVERLVLYRSHLSPGGARYEPLHVVPLGSA